MDVDGTLGSCGVPNEKVLAYLRKVKVDGYTLILWSLRGEDYARKVAAAFDVTELFTHILSKPGFILDDQGWNWTRYSSVIRKLT